MVEDAQNAPPPKKRDDIADERAQYNWNAAANAVADPAPGGDVPVAKMAGVSTGKAAPPAHRTTLRWVLTRVVPLSSPLSALKVVEDAQNAPPPKKQDSIAHQRAQYNWNAAANAIADPAPGGDVPVPKMAQVSEAKQSWARAFDSGFSIWLFTFTRPFPLLPPQPI